MLEKDLRRAIAITRIITVDKRLDVAFRPQDLMDLVAQFAGPHAVNHDHRRQMVGHGQVEILFKGLQLQR